MIVLAPSGPGLARSAPDEGTTTSPATSTAEPPSDEEALQVRATCPISVRDAARPGDCIQASSTPTVGMLYPMSDWFRINPQGESFFGGQVWVDGQVWVRETPTQTHASLVVGATATPGEQSAAICLNGLGVRNAGIGFTPRDDNRSRIDFAFGNSSNPAWEPNSSRFSILENGNVGVGTTEPETSLQVNGALSFVRDPNDEANAGKIAYRGLTPFDALAITGVGTTNTNRRVHLYDSLSVGDTSGGQFNVNFVQGHVGIGTTDPRTPLHIQKSDGPAQLRIESRNSEANLDLLSDGTGQCTIYSPSGTDDLYFFTGGSNRHAMTASGKLGVGTVHPQAMLEVESRSNEPMRQLFRINDLSADGRGATELYTVGGPSRDIGITNSWADLHLGASGAGESFVKMLTVTTAGKVGIGTTQPSQKLTVAGIIETTSGGIKFPDGTIQTTAAGGGGGGGGIGGVQEYVADGVFVVPQNVTTILVEMWGGGGGEDGQLGCTGGSGAYVRSVLAVNPGEALLVEVGRGGDTDVSGTSSVIRRGPQPLASAGGGERGFVNRPGNGGVATAPNGIVRNGAPGDGCDEYDEGGYAPYGGRSDNGVRGDGGSVEYWAEDGLIIIQW
ncbi:MAG: hypothetical protein C4547_11375 [Phycisphaerales bacterium]|nr:MAG: hypothetical protein C4547_11375 [Phycisphaerales bacterium]